MRGGVCWDTMMTSSACVQQGNLPMHYSGYQTTSVMTVPTQQSAPVTTHNSATSDGQSQGINMAMTQSGATSTQIWPQLLIPKQEPMDEDHKTDSSGIHSGSDFHSSSPGSDSSLSHHDYPTTIADMFNSPTSQPQQLRTPSFYTTPPMTGGPHHKIPSTSSYNTSTNAASMYPYHLGFNPLTPPSNEPSMHSPKGTTTTTTTPITQDLTGDGNHHLTPSSSPTLDKTVIDENPLKQLQMTFEKTNEYLPASLSSPKMSEHSNEDDSKSDTMEEYDEQGLRIPKVNSHGKVKMFKCKQCDFVAITKLDFWEHSKAHIKTDKLLTCPKCPFVTEYKHHLEYHLRNHFGSKPFKCDKCSYSCVNKSMLNSHMKSHSNIYQYRCADCSYATKYCHSLKLHLRKYCHKPAMVLNADGTPNPLPIIDVYGTRRGPKVKSNPQEEQLQQQQGATQLQNHHLAQMMMNTPPQHPHQLQLPFPYPFLSGFPNPLNNPMFFPAQMAQLQHQLQKSPSSQVDDDSDHQEQEREPSPLALPLEKYSPEALDLSKPDSNETPTAATKNRRKGKAFKLDRSVMNNSTWSDEDEEEAKQDEEEEHEYIECETKLVVDEDEVVNTTPKQQQVQVQPKDTTTSVNNNYTCQFCNIAFGDAVLYTMHMGYHGYNDPFACNMCGEQCNDKVAFFLHIARNPHT